MKGVIAQCLGELVSTKFGQDKWEQSLEDAGMPKTMPILPISDLDDALVLKVVDAVCRNLNLSLAQAADAFGDYWVNVYSQKMYSAFYAKHKSARGFLSDMNALHVAMTKSMKNAKPPRFEHEWQDDKTLVIHYRSHRNLVDFAVGLIKGVGKHYHERLGVTKLGADKIQVTFP
jgi:hypothetical protein